MNILKFIFICKTDTYNAAAKREKEIFCLVLNLTGVLVRANALKNKIDSSIMEILKVILVML